jgi:hypothetical protein
MLGWLRGRRPSASEIVVLRLNDERLERDARNIAEFASVHHGAGHYLVRLPTKRGHGQTIICKCEGTIKFAPDAGMRASVVEDELIDDG